MVSGGLEGGPVSATEAAPAETGGVCIGAPPFLNPFEGCWEGAADLVWPSAEGMGGGGVGGDEVVGLEGLEGSGGGGGGACWSSGMGGGGLGPLLGGGGGRSGDDACRRVAGVSHEWSVALPLDAWVRSCTP